MLNEKLNRCLVFLFFPCLFLSVFLVPILGKLSYMRKIKEIKKGTCCPLQVNELTAFLFLHKKISLTILAVIYEEDSGVGRLSASPLTRTSKLQLFTNQLLMKRLETTRKYLQ